METVDPTPFYKFVGLDHGNTFEIAANKTKLTVEVFNCDHAIPTISYGFSETRKKMKPVLSILVHNHPSTRTTHRTHMYLHIVHEGILWVHLYRCLRMCSFHLVMTFEASCQRESMASTNDSVNLLSFLQLTFPLGISQITWSGDQETADGRSGHYSGCGV